ncbi:hypothetical protein VNO78_22520 [Psophocarpus tetragonolobus]|uniref:Uncharacterized protein n=1 Tax=Psophocarpus tetragonolobus TaxID=3891 RepID=A0AAN9S1S1_PSOTE
MKNVVVFTRNVTRPLIREVSCRVVSSKEVSLHNGRRIFLLRSLSKISEYPLIQLWIFTSVFLSLNIKW